MNTSDMIMKGQILHLKENRNDRNVVIGYTAQFMKKSQKGYDILNVRLPEGSKPDDYKEGTAVELAVDFSVYEGSLFFRATRDLRGEGRAETRADRPSPASTKANA